MKPVYQTLFGNIDGNCFASCVASILELDLKVVPNFCKHLDWFERFEKWLLKYDSYPLNFYNGYPIPGIHILSGGSPRGDWLHAVVANGDKIIHDPHKDGTNIKTKYSSIIIVPMDPLIVRKRSCLSAKK